MYLLLVLIGLFGYDLPRANAPKVFLRPRTRPSRYSLFLSAWGIETGQPEPVRGTPAFTFRVTNKYSFR